MPTLIITVDPQCCRCITKLQNILCCIQDRGEFVIDKISYEKDKVHVSGPFVAEKLYCKLLCKAGKIIKGIEVAKPPKPNPPKCTCVCVCVCTPESKPDPAKCTCVCVCTPEPKPDPRKCTCVCVCVCVCVCTPEPKPKPDPAKCMRACVSGCPTPNCKCHSKPPPPPPPKPPTCACPTWPSCHCYSYPSTPMPYSALLVCEENPPYGACAVM